LGQETFKLEKEKAFDISSSWEADSSISIYRMKYQLALLVIFKRIKKKLDYRLQL